MTASNRPAPMSGRRAEAARNDGRILEAARAVFTADPEAPISAVAKRAGVGISALYRRYASKDELLQRLAADGLQRYLVEARAATSDSADPWSALEGFMHRALDTGAGSLSVRFAGKFTASEELQRAGAEGNRLTQQLLERAQRAGVVRRDIEIGDIHLLLEQLQSIHVRDPQRAHELRHRYLALFLEAIRGASPTPLPGPPPTWEEIRNRYDA